MKSREQRIMTLATTLKSSGIAKTDSQARMMAEDMIGVEEHVQKSYEEEHVRAHEYLQTAKNLGDPRQSSQSTSQVKSAKIEPLSISQKASLKESTKTPVKELGEYVQQMPRKGSPGPEYTDVNFGARTLNQANAEAQSHDTHNSALEEIKKQIKNAGSVPTIEKKENVVQPVTAQSLLEEVSTEDVLEDASEEVATGSPEVVAESSDVLEAPESESLKNTDAVDAVEDTSVIEEIPIGNENVPVVEEVSSDDNVLPVFEADSDKEQSSVAKEVAGEEVSVESDVAVEDEKLDTQKLVEMMEEDGKLEEHTRQITEKPKDVKPKEAYEENNIDLGNVFNFNKK